MKDLTKMTSKELKEMAKELKVAGWWNLSKAALIDGIQRKQAANNTKSEIKEEENSNIIPIKSNRRKRVTNKSSEAPVAKSETISEEPKQNTKAEPKRSNLKLTELTYKGKTQSIRAWAEELEMPWPTLYDRVNRNGWSVEDAIEIPLGQRRPK